MFKIGDHLAAGGHLLTGNELVFHLNIVQHLSLKHNIADELLVVRHMYFPNCAKLYMFLTRRTLNVGNNIG